MNQNSERESGKASLNGSVILWKIFLHEPDVPPAIIAANYRQESMLDVNFLLKICYAFGTVAGHRFSFLLPKTVLFMQFSTNST